jgi:hypothetical protein
LPSISFQYSALELPPTPPFPNGQTVFRPLMEAHVIGPSGKFQTCFVCLDTGADQCIFPLSFASLVGLDPLQMPMQFTGGCGSTANTTYYGMVEIQLRFAGVPGVPMFAFKTYAGFTPGMDNQGIGLLGQIGFFENFQYRCSFSFPMTFHDQTKGEAFY